jgi:hypothetical protein
MDELNNPDRDDNNSSPVDNDSVVKELLLTSKVLPSLLFGTQVVQVEPMTTEYAHKPRRADYCATIDKNSILHIEFQTSSDPDIPLRMALYWLLMRLTLKPKVQIHQYMINVGLDKTENKKQECEIYGQKTGFEVIDSKSLDPAPFLASGDWNDNVFSLYCGGDENEKIQKIRERHRQMRPEELYDAERKLLIAAGMRNMLRQVQAGVDMRFSSEILAKDPFFAEKLNEKFVKGIEQGIEQGVDRGRRQLAVEFILDEARAKGWVSLAQIVEAARKADGDDLKIMMRSVALLDNEGEFLAQFRISGGSADQSN